MDDKEYKKIWAEFEQKYDLSSMDTANDRQNLELLIRSAIIARKLLTKAENLVATDDSADILQIKRLLDAVRDTIEKNLSLERQLGIDRKSRRKDDEVTGAQYILFLKQEAKNFLDQRMIKIFCPDCNIMVGRILPVHDHTAYDSAFQCTQCGRFVGAIRKERDVFFDIAANDREWRKRYPVEIRKPKKRKVLDTVDVEAELIIGEDETTDD